MLHGDLRWTGSGCLDLVQLRGLDESTEKGQLLAELAANGSANVMPNLASFSFNSFDHRKAGY